MLAALGVALVGGAPERAPTGGPQQADARPVNAPRTNQSTKAAGSARATVPESAVASAANAPDTARATDDTGKRGTPNGDGAATEAGGAAPTAAEGSGLRALSLDAVAMRAALAAVPALASLAAEFVPFSDADTDAALRRGGRSRASIAVWTFQPAAFAWSPRAGRELWVLSGRAGARALIAVLEPKGEQRFEHVASLVLQEPELTVAVGYSDQYRDQLVWSTCYGCAGEGGTIRSREDGRIEFAYR
jgi:hypothetical protein